MSFYKFLGNPEVNTMSMNELQKQTNANIQAKANLIWEIATHLVGLFNECV